MIVKSEFDLTDRADARHVGWNKLPECEEIKPLIGFLRNTRYSEQGFFDWNLSRCFEGFRERRRSSLVRIFGPARPSVSPPPTSTRSIPPASAELAT